MEKFSSDYTTTSTNNNLTTSKSEPDNYDINPNPSKKLDANSPSTHIEPLKSTPLSTSLAQPLPPPPAPQLLSSDPPIIPSLKKGKIDILNRVNANNNSSNLLEVNSNKQGSKRSSPFEKFNLESSPITYHQTARPHSPLELLNNNNDINSPLTKLSNIETEMMNKQDSSSGNSNKRVKTSSIGVDIINDYNSDKILNHQHQYQHQQQPPPTTLPNMSIISERRISLPSYDSISNNSSGGPQFERNSKIFKLPPLPPSTTSASSSSVANNLGLQHHYHQQHHSHSTHHLQLQHHELKSNVMPSNNNNSSEYNSRLLPYQMPQLQDNSSLIVVVDKQAQPVSLLNMMEVLDHDSNNTEYPNISPQITLTHTYNHRSLLPDYSSKINSIVKVRIARSYLKWGWFHDRIRDHEVWGSMIYTDDSDLISVLVHLGFLKLPQPPEYNPNSPNKPCIPGIPQGFNLINDWIVEIRILPKLPNYSGTDLKGYRSRSWGSDHDGVSYQVLKVYLANSSTNSTGGGNNDDRSTGHHHHSHNQAM